MSGGVNVIGGAPGHRGNDWMTLVWDAMTAGVRRWIKARARNGARTDVGIV